MALSMAPEHLKRYAEIARLLARHGRSDIVQRAGLASVLDGEREPPTAGDLDDRAALLVEDLERLGPTYIKLGQLLATRVDLLPPPYIEALARLQDAVEPFPFEEVERTVSEELGVRLTKAFGWFDPRPMASASLAQVHRARLRFMEQVRGIDERN